MSSELTRKSVLIKWLENYMKAPYHAENGKISRSVEWGDTILRRCQAFTFKTMFIIGILDYCEGDDGNINIIYSVYALSSNDKEFLLTISIDADNYNINILNDDLNNFEEQNNIKSIVFIRSVSLVIHYKIYSLTDVEISKYKLNPYENWIFITAYRFMYTGHSNGYIHGFEMMRTGHICTVKPNGFSAHPSHTEFNASISFRNGILNYECSKYDILHEINREKPTKILCTTEHSLIDKHDTIDPHYLRRYKLLPNSVVHPNYIISSEFIHKPFNYDIKYNNNAPCILRKNPETISSVSIKVLKASIQFELSMVYDEIPTKLFENFLKITELQQIDSKYIILPDKRFTYVCSLMYHSSGEFDKIFIELIRTNKTYDISSKNYIDIVLTIIFKHLLNYVVKCERVKITYGLMKIFSGKNPGKYLERKFNRLRLIKELVIIGKTLDILKNEFIDLNSKQLTILMLGEVVLQETLRQIRISAGKYDSSIKSYLIDGINDEDEFDNNFKEFSISFPL